MDTKADLIKLLKTHKAEELGMALGYSKETIIRLRDGKSKAREGIARAINAMANGERVELPRV